MKSFFEYKFGIESLEDLLEFLTKTPNQRAACISILLALPHFFKYKNDLTIALPWSYNSMTFSENPFYQYIEELFVTNDEDRKILEFLITYICIPVEDPNIEKWTVERIDFGKVDFYKCNLWVTVMINIYKQDTYMQGLKEYFLINAGSGYSPYKKVVYFSNQVYHDRFYTNPLFKGIIDPKYTIVVDHPYPFCEDWQDIYLHQLHFRDDDEKNGGGLPALEFEPGQ